MVFRDPSRFFLELPIGFQIVFLLFLSCFNKKSENVPDFFRFLSRTVPFFVETTNLGFIFWTDFAVSRNDDPSKINYKRALCAVGDILPPSNLYFCASGIPDRSTGENWSIFIDVFHLRQKYWHFRRKCIVALLSLRQDKTVNILG